MDLANTMQMDDVSDDDDNLNIDDNNTDVRGYLVRIDTEGNHQTPFILTKATTTIGRKKSNDIVLTNPTISSNHAEVIINTLQHIAYIVDLKSTNKTRIGQQLPSKDRLNNKIVPNRECIVKSRDYVTFGDVQFIFYHEDDYDEYQQQMHAPCNSNALIAATQRFDEEEDEEEPTLSVTAVNTAANRSNKEEVDLKLSLSDDETQMKQKSPKRVQFASQQSNIEPHNDNMEPTLVWDDDSEDTGHIQLAATMPFDDEDGIQLEATVAFEDIEETEDVQEDKDQVLAATMAFEDDDNEDNKGVLAATMAFDDVDEFESVNQKENAYVLPATIPIDDAEETELAATMAIDDDADNTGELAATMAIDDEEDNDKRELEATMAFEDDENVDNTGELAATMAIDDEDDDVLPATVAIDDVDDVNDAALAATMVMDDVVSVGDDPLPATVAIDDDDEVLEATMAMDDNSDNVGDEPLPATVAIDDENDTVDEDALPATVAMDDDGDNEEDILPATIAIEDDNQQELDATMAIEDTEEEEELAATMAIEDDEGDDFQSERPPMDATLAVMTEDDEPLAATIPIETEDIDLNSTVDSNTNDTEHTLPATIAVDEEEETQNHNEVIIPSQPKEEEEEPQEAVSVVKSGRRRGRRKTKTDEREEEKAVTETTHTPKSIPKRRRSARIAKQNTVNKVDEDGDITMENKPLKKRGKKKNVSSLTSLCASRGSKENKVVKKDTKKRGRKRNIKEREKEEEEYHNGDKDEDKEVKPPPTKRPRRGRMAKRSKIVSEAENENKNTNNGLRRSTRNTKKASPNRRRNKRFQDLSSESDDDKIVVLLRTGTDNKSQKKSLEALGAVVLSEYDDTVTHIVSTQPRRTLKFISGMATAKHIVTDRWLTECIKKKTFKVDEDKYFPNNKATREFENKYGFKLKESFSLVQQRKEPLFDGYKVYFTKEHKANVKKAIGTMAQSHGAALMSRIPKATASGTVDMDIIVIGADVKHKHCKNVEKKGYTIYNRDIIITSILRQNIDFDDDDFQDGK